MLDEEKQNLQSSQTEIDKGKTTDEERPKENQTAISTEKITEVNVEKNASGIQEKFDNTPKDNSSEITAVPETETQPLTAENTTANIENKDTDTNEEKPNKVDLLAETPTTNNGTPSLPVENEETTNEIEKIKEENNSNVEHEIDKANAEEGEDEGHKEKHKIPFLDYHSMSMEALNNELRKLTANEKIQAIKSHVDQIKYEFDLKFQELLEQKKEDFLNDGGNEIDFSFHYPPKLIFNELHREYRDKRNKYYKDLESKLKLNLAERQDIIEELKGLINVEEDINTTYKHFKELQERWRHAGPIPKMEYHNIWRTYHHHVERFYDFLDINRDLRDLDFKHNLEEKEKIIARARQLAEETDINKAFRELQELHKIWKEDIGPVDKEHRESVWQQFREATKIIHDKRQDYFKNLDAIYEENLVKKNEIIAKIKEIAEQNINTHGLWQKQIREIEALREAFFNAGKVPHRVNEDVWAAFKETVRSFNRKKNAFYKGLKKEQHRNYEQKLALVKLAESLKDSEDWDETTPIMKKIQSDWKKIGHVPRKFSDKVWKDFKTACNHYFDRLHAQKNEAYKEEYESFEKKAAILDELRSYKLTGEKEKDLEQIQAFIASWKGIGRVPFNKKNIESKFNKILDALFNKIGVAKNEAELIKYENKLEQLANAKSEYALNNERVFIRRKIDELNAQIRQLENNLQFFSNASENNPVVKDVVRKINNHKKDLDLWKAKLKQIRSFK